MDKIIELLQQGMPLVIVEWRGYRAENVKLTDAKTGRVRDTGVIRHACEMGPDQVAITQWLPDGTDATKVVVPYKRGDKLVLRIEGWSRQSGSWAGRGQFLEVPVARKGQ